MQNRPKKQESGCPACGMMSFPSKTGVFSQPKEEPKKEEANQVSLTQKTDSTPEVIINDCPACGLMSFPSNAPR